MEHFFHEYAAILADPAHAAVELTNNLLVDGLLLGLLWPWLKRRFRRDIEREHQVLDQEHGVNHQVLVDSPLAFDGDLPYDYERQGT